MELIFISTALVITNVLFLQALGFPLLDADIAFTLIIAVQFGFLFLYAYLQKSKKKHNIAQLLLHSFGGNDVALYNKKGKLLGARGTFFNKTNPIIEIEKRIQKFDFNDPLALSKLQTSILLGQDIMVEVALSNDNGDIIFAKISVTFFKKRPHYVLWKLQDISAERSISEAFRSELKYLGEFMDNLPIGLYLADASGKICFVNNTLCDWFGTSYKNIEGKKISDFTDNSQSPDFSGAWQGTLSFKGQYGTFPALVRHSTYDSGGKTMFRSIVIKDIEQSDKAMKLLKETEIRFQWIFEETPVGIAFADNDFIINDGNDALFGLLHSHREQAIGTNLKDYIAPSDIEKLNKARSIIIKNKEKAANVELTIINKEGQMVKIASVFLTAMTGLNHSKPSHIEGIVMHFIDNTASQQLADQLSQAQKMQAMGLMAGGIAHNFNNTLTAIIGFCDLVIQRIDENDPSTSDIKRIKDNANRSANLIKSLLTYSRNQPSKVKPIDLNSFLADTYHFLKVTIPENIEIKTEYSRHIGQILFDEVKLQQIINNLINNAHEAIAPNNGLITIKTKPQKFKTEVAIENDVMPPGNYVLIEIEDTGSGIAPEIISKVFDPFFSTKKDSDVSGSGFGLSIVLGDVRQAGGFIVVESTLNVGTKFTIYLPELTSEEMINSQNDIVAEDFISPLSIKSKIESDGQMAFTQISEPNKIKSIIDTSGNAKILFIEDEEAVRAFGVRALTNKGYVVTDCACAEDALEIIEKGERFDLIASDVVMPGMSGTDLAAKVKEIIPNIKILLMSGYFSDIANIDSYNYNFLSKPFSLDQLTTKIKEVIEEK